MAGQVFENFLIIIKLAAFLNNKLFSLVSFLATMALPLHYYFLANVWGQVKNFAAKEPYHHKYWIYWTWPALTKEPNETKRKEAGFFKPHISSNGLHNEVKFLLIEDFLLVYSQKLWKCSKIIENCTVTCGVYWMQQVQWNKLEIVLIAFHLMRSQSNVKSTGWFCQTFSFSEYHTHWLEPTFKLTLHLKPQFY